MITGGAHNGSLTAHRLASPDITVTLPAAYAADHVQLGYATTQTRVQSLTVDAALCAVTATSRRPQLYVGLTRGRAENHLLVVTDQPQHDPDTPPDHLPPDHIIDTIMRRGTAQPLTIPAGTHHLATDVAAAHLARIVDTPHNTPMPDLDQLGIRGSLGAAQTDGAEGVETCVGEAIGAWLDQQHATEAVDDGADRAWEDSFLAALDDGGDVEALYASDGGEPDGWTPPLDGLAPDELAPDDLAPDDLRVDDDPDASPAGADPARAEPRVVAPVVRVGQPDDEAVEAAAAEVVDAWGADHLEPFLALADQWAGQPGPHPLDDPGPLVDLTARYQMALRGGDRTAAAHTVALLTAVADPTLRAMLAPPLAHQPLTDDEKQWAADVRTSLRARRAERWRPTLEALNDARTQLHHQIPDGHTPTDYAADADRRYWHQAVAAWLDDGASATRLSAVWHTTTRLTAQVIAGYADPPPQDTAVTPGTPPSPSRPPPAASPPLYPPSSYPGPPTRRPPATTATATPAGCCAVAPTGTTTNSSAPPTPRKPAATSPTVGSPPMIGRSGIWGGHRPDGGDCATLSATTRPRWSPASPTPRSRLAGPTTCCGAGSCSPSAIWPET